MIILVTGASSGFGEEIARKFVRHGHRVIAAARRHGQAGPAASGTGRCLVAANPGRNRQAVNRQGSRRTAGRLESD